MCARFTAAGAVLDGDAIRLSLPAGPPSVFWDGSKYLVVSGAQAQRVDPVGLAPAFAADLRTAERMVAWWASRPAP
jgi:hypothetical protein